MASKALLFDIISGKLCLLVAHHHEVEAEVAHLRGQASQLVVSFRHEILLGGM
jgi:hypothetical protein